MSKNVTSFKELALKYTPWLLTGVGVIGIILSLALYSAQSKVSNSEPANAHSVRSPKN